MKFTKIQIEWLEDRLINPLHVSALLSSPDRELSRGIVHNMVQLQMERIRMVIKEIRCGTPCECGIKDEGSELG